MKRHLSSITLRILPAWVALIVSLTGCKSTRDDAMDEGTRPEPEAATSVEPRNEPPSRSVDQDLNSFLAALREAATAQDMYKLASLMTQNFGYQLDPPLEGDGVFHYWDQNNLWGELALIVGEEFVPNGDFMVAPPEFADPATLYSGYRAGIAQIGGEWKFAYFVRD